MVDLVNKSNNQDIDGILWGYKWSSRDLTYSFPTTTSKYLVGQPEGYEAIVGFSSLNAKWQTAFTKAMAQVASFTTLKFTPSDANKPTFRFGEATKLDLTSDPQKGRDNQLREIGAAAQGFFPELSYNGTPPALPENSQGDVWVSTGQSANDPNTNTGYCWIVLHEFGHALGLKHGHMTSSTHGVTFPILPTDHNSSEYSVMTYKAYVGEVNDSQFNKDGFSTYMQDDIAALQYLYGANYNFRSGATVYKWDPISGEQIVNEVGQGANPNNQKIFMTVWDGGGDDTYDFSNYSTQITADLRPGQWINLSTQIADFGGNHFARGNIANALIDPNNPNETASLIENVIGGTSSDTLIGNKVGNIIKGGFGADFIDGQQGSDSLFGEAGNDRIFGHDDDDFLRGGEGDDVLDGGNGIDRASYIDATSGVTVSLSNSGAQAVGGGRGSDKLTNIENLLGGAFNDSLTGNNSNNILEGGEGDDALYGFGGNDSLFGGDGNDLLRGGAGNDLIDGGIGFNKVSFALATGSISVSLNNNESQTIGGGEGSDRILNVQDVIGGKFNDTIWGNETSNSIEGYDGNDVIYAAGGADYILGGAGNDLIRGGAGNDIIFGGSGIDRASYIDASSGVTVNLSIALQQDIGGGLGADTLKEIEDLLGSSFGDDLTGNDGNNVIDADNGNDTIIGLGGNDTIYGRNGHDKIRGGFGNDIIDGGDGSDRASFYDATSNVTVDLRNTNAQNVGGGLGSDKLINIENVLGGLYNDTITGNALANQLEGDNGNDSLFGLAGNDNLYGGNGSDLLNGGSGDDLLDGGTGIDVAIFDGATAGITLDLSRNTSQVIGGGLGSDTLIDIENVMGSAFNDSIRGNVFANTIFGLSGNDAISGGGGDDALIGGAGADILEGGEGSDTFTYNSGDSLLNSYDRITDFAVGQDKINLAAIDANSGAAGDQSFTYIGSAAFSANSAGQIRYSDGYLYGNINNDTTADFKIQIDTTGVITARDFYL